MNQTRPLQAALSILAAMVLIGFIDNYVVVIAETGGLWQFHLLRTAMILPMLVAVALIFGVSLRPRRWQAVVGRSLFISTAMILYFGSLAFLPITQSVAGLFTSPLFVLLITGVFLRERVGPIRMLAAALGFGGVLLVLQPWGAEVSPWAALAVASGFFYAVGAMATRRWCAGEETLTLTGAMFVAMALWGVLGLGLLAIFPQDAPAGADGFVLRGWVAPGGTFLFWTAVQAVGSLVAVWLITRAYQLGEAPFVALFEYSLLVSVSAWAFALKGERPDALALVGIALIVAAGAVIALRERRLTPPAPEAPA